MHELRPFIEKSRVILIALQDKVLPGTQLEAAAKILCDATDQK
jgi:hypothetical protein